jgi:hypothetical protein
MLSDGHGTRAVFARVGMKTSDRVKVESFDELLRQKRLPHIKRSLNDRAQKIVLSVAVGYF